MKDILFINPSLKRGGAEILLVNIANSLVRKGYNVDIITIFPGDDLSHLLDNRVNFSIFHKPPYIGKWRVKGIGRLFSYWLTYSSPKHLYKSIVNKKYDVEVAFFRGHCVKIISGSTNVKSKKIAWVHNDFRICGEINGGFKKWKNIIYAYKKFDKIVAVSESAKHGFIEKMGISKNICSIPNLNPIKEIKKMSNYKIDITKTRFTICSVGRLSKQKGFDRLLNVCKRLNDENINFDLWIIGDGPEKDKLLNLKYKHKLDNVYFLGMKDNPYKYMKQADLVVVSSLHEGYCLVVAEAIILEKPVVSTYCTGPDEILNKGEYGVLTENNENGLYSGIKQMITDKEIYNYYKMKTIDRKEFFNEEKIIKQIESLF